MGDVMSNKELRVKAIRDSALQDKDGEGEALLLASAMINRIKEGTNSIGVASRAVQLLMLGICREFVEIDGVVYMNDKLQPIEEIDTDDEPTIH